VLRRCGARPAVRHRDEWFLHRDARARAGLPGRPGSP